MGMKNIVLISVFLLISIFSAYSKAEDKSNISVKLDISIENSLNSNLKMDDVKIRNEAVKTIRDILEINKDEEYAREHGKTELSEETVNNLKKVFATSSGMADKNLFEIFYAIDPNFLKNNIGHFLASDSPSSKIFAMQLIEKSKLIGQYKDEILKISKNDADKNVSEEAVFVLAQTNEPGIIDEIEDKYEDITEIIKAIDNAYQRHDVKLLIASMNEQTGFYLELLDDSGDHFRTQKVLTLDEAESFFSGNDTLTESTFYDVKNINGIQINDKSFDGVQMKKDSKGRILFYVDHSNIKCDWHQLFPEVLAGKPIILMAVILKKPGHSDLIINGFSRAIGIILTKINSKWYF